MESQQLAAWASVNFSSTALSEHPLTAALEHRELSAAMLDKICKPQLAPVWQFLVDRVKSKSEANEIRQALDYAANHSQSRTLQMLTEYKQSRQTRLADRHERIQKRNDLKKRIQQQKRVIEQKELAFRTSLDIVTDSESQLKAFQTVVQEKKRKLELQEAYEKDALEFIGVLKEYSGLLISLLDLKARKGEVGSALVDEVFDIQGIRKTFKLTEQFATLQEGIKTLCDRIERHYFHPSVSGPRTDTDTDIILKIQSLVVSGECQKLLQVLYQITRLASESLFQQQKDDHHPPRELISGRSCVGNENQSIAIKKELHKSTRMHILRFAETKHLKQQTEKILTEMEQYMHSVEDEIENPETAKIAIAHMQAAADHEAYKSVVKSLDTYIQGLEAEVRDGKGAAFELKESQEEINRLGKELTRKHGLIASIMEANILSRSNIVNVKARNEQVAISRICSQSIPTSTIVSSLSGYLAREVHALGGVRLSDPAVESIRDAGRFVESVSCPQEVMQELKTALEMPVYLAIDKIPNYIQELKNILSFYKSMTLIANQTNQETSLKNLAAMYGIQTESTKPGMEMLYPLVDTITDSSAKYTRNMNQLIDDIRNVTMQDAEKARIVSTSISHLKDKLENRMRQQ
ncbi:UNVERIFIED_CONTAM: hypothetical protein HDU68_007729 [Siphonaria sp. JEL0065]|nr:hypothetical protein HDU68_007729 [Siphonaria sp. JEL0065]